MFRIKCNNVHKLLSTLPNNWNPKIFPTPEPINLYKLFLLTIFRSYDDLEPPDKNASVNKCYNFECVIQSYKHTKQMIIHIKKKRLL